MATPLSELLAQESPLDDQGGSDAVASAPASEYTGPYRVQAPVRACGRRTVLAMLDTMLGEEHNIRRMRTAFQEALDTTPLAFFRDIVMPLTPNSMLEVGAGGQTPEEIAAEIRAAAKAMDEGIGMDTAPAPANQTQSGPPASGARV